MDKREAAHLGASMSDLMAYTFAYATEEETGQLLEQRRLELKVILKRIAELCGVDLNSEPQVQPLDTLDSLSKEWEILEGRRQGFSLQIERDWLNNLRACLVIPPDLEERYSKHADPLMRTLWKRTKEWAERTK